MDTYSFKFCSKYSGFWKLPTADEDIPGNLLLSEHDISLELLSTKEIGHRNHSPIDISGIAQSDDKKNYHFYLSGARLKNWSCSVINRSIYDIDEIILCEDEYTSNELISSVNIRTIIADKWLSQQIFKSFSFSYKVNAAGEVQVTFKPQGDIPLCDFDDFRVSFYLGYGNYNEMTSVTLGSKAFINVEYKNDGINLVQAETLVEKIVHFFTLIWNRSFEPDYVTYFTHSIKFIKKVSDKVSHKYFDKNRSYDTYTDFEDFSGFDKIGEMLKVWLALYKEYEPALSAYFEVNSNKRTAPRLVLKTYIFVLETLAKNYCAEQDPLPEGNKRRVLLKKIADKYKISNNEWSELENMFLLEKKGTTKSKIKALVDEIKNVLPSAIDDSFINKAVNTRHNITHGEKYNKVSFGKDEFGIVNYRLSQVIRAYLLNRIGAPDIVYGKILQFGS